MKATSNSIMNAYLLFGAAYCLAVLFSPDTLAWYTKPLLMPILFGAVRLHSGMSNQKLLLAALFFSWLGDIALMFLHVDPNFFIAGLLAFLIAHILYIVLFGKSFNKEVSAPKVPLASGLAVILLYLFSLGTLLFPLLGDMLAPVAVYALTICTMLAFAWFGHFGWPAGARYWVLAGAAIFVVSDSFIAFNKFYAPVPQSAFLVMSTYIVAQYCIVRGIMGLKSS